MGDNVRAADGLKDMLQELVKDAVTLGVDVDEDKDPEDRLGVADVENKWQLHNDHPKMPCSLHDGRSE